MTVHDLMRELAEKAGHATTVTAGAIGSVYSLFIQNPIGFICAVVAVASFVVNWYYSHRRLKLQEKQTERQ
ncbi:holin [uncultured Microbulbifer sp.]|uniref:holin n=1 Tax=uncultured Microbulbifer sp. TaxID=348147 RepID=UPI0026325DA6|nr:holin [uncultured Microbulbifer sp.]